MPTLILCTTMSTEVFMKLLADIQERDGGLTPIPGRQIRLSNPKIERTTKRVRNFGKPPPISKYAVVSFGSYILATNAFNYI